MNEPTESVLDKAVDSIQERLTSYACSLDYKSLPPEVIHSAKVHTIDALGGLIGGLDGEPCRIARKLAARMPQPDGATVIGTGLKTTPDVAALANGIAVRYAGYDVYHSPGSYQGHPSDVLTPVLAAGEHARASGRGYIVGLVLAYEIYCHIADVFKNRNFDSAVFTSLAVAAAAGKLLNLSSAQLAHCISMAVVPNIVLRQVRRGAMSMWTEVAAGYAGRAGVFAALLARDGMDGPDLPFEGTSGWCAHVAFNRFSLPALGGNGTHFKILDTWIKNRPALSEVICCILATEKIAPLQSVNDVKQVTVEVHKYGKERGGTDKHRLDPYTREAAEHSIPYVVATTLIDGKVTLSSYRDARLQDPQLRNLIHKIEVIENAEFTQAWERTPREHHSRVTVVMRSGERLVAKAGGGPDDMAAPRSDEEIIEKFRETTDEVLGAKRVSAILERLWHLDELENISEIPAAFVLG